MPNTKTFQSFKKYIVAADNLRDFCDKYHNYKYSEEDYNDHKKDIENYGFTFIPHHDSKTGDIVSYYGKID